MPLEFIDSYYNSNIYKPLYFVVGDSDYHYCFSKLVGKRDIEIIRMSSFCSDDDKKPNLDKLRETLRMADVDCESNKLLIIGLGEFLSLEGKDVSYNILNELINFNLGSAHAVFLLRGVTEVVNEILDGDIRLKDRQIKIKDDAKSGLEFSFSSPDLNLYDVNGFKNALFEVESGKSNKINANTALVFPNTNFPISYIKDSFVAVQKKLQGFSESKKIGTEQNWDDLLADLKESSDINGVFEKYGFDYSLNEFYSRINGEIYRCWLYYLFLRMYKNQISNKYLKTVINFSDSLENFRKNVINYISNISYKSNDFIELYNERKMLVKDYPESDMAAFVLENRVNNEESIYKLTDRTVVEREEIIAEIAQQGVPKNLEMIYPDLKKYLSKYYFEDDTLSEVLTEYFDQYKHQKINNSISEEFLSQVDSLALSRVYNRLRTRDEIINSINHESTFLCWIDALGVEYLSFIKEKAKEKGLSVSVKIGRAELPTITCINRKFYDNWPDDQKHKIDELDELKHKEKGGYKYGPSNLYPIHLAKELDVISNAIDEAATDLSLHKYDKYIITSDHGASRLAVIRKKEEKYDTDTQGMHSGRCCKIFKNYNLPFATEDNGYIVLADYGRFKGSRAANVEVHGGASLEEVVVPVISLSLKDTSINVRIVEDTIKADYKSGVQFTLFINKELNENVYIKYKGKKFNCTKKDLNHYLVDVSDINKAGEFEIDVYSSDALISHLMLYVTSKSASVNTDFDDLF